MTPTACHPWKDGHLDALGSWQALVHARPRVPKRAPPSTRQGSEAHTAGEQVVRYLDTPDWPQLGSGIPWMNSEPNDPGAPVRAAFIAPETRSVELDRELPLDLGGALRNVRIAYRSWGELDASGDNAVVLCHALTGSADADRWWTGLFGPGRALDPEHDFIICSNILGSCYGTTGPTSVNSETGRPWLGDFPAITVRDMVRAQRELLPAARGSPGPHGARRIAGWDAGAGVGALLPGPRRVDGPHRLQRPPLGVGDRALGGAAAGHLRRPALARRAVRPGRSAGGRARRGPDDGDVHVPPQVELRRAVRTSPANGRPLRDRELPPISGAAAGGALRRGHVRHAHAGDGHPRRGPGARRLTRRCSARCGCRP